jgi:hypothetical protein
VEGQVRVANDVSIFEWRPKNSRALISVTVFSGAVRRWTSEQQSWSTIVVVQRACLVHATTTCFVLVILSPVIPRVIAFQLRLFLAAIYNFCQKLRFAHMKNVFFCVDKRDEYVH